MTIDLRDFPTAEELFEDADEFDVWPVQATGDPTKDWPLGWHLAEETLSYCRQANSKVPLHIVQGTILFRLANGAPLTMVELGFFARTGDSAYVASHH